MDIPCAISKYEHMVITNYVINNKEKQVPLHGANIPKKIKRYCTT